MRIAVAMMPRPQSINAVGYYRARFGKTAVRWQVLILQSLISVARPLWVTGTEGALVQTLVAGSARDAQSALVSKVRYPNPYIQRHQRNHNRQ
jgi:hypothetical protein